jgi:hypothetical protein
MLQTLMNLFARRDAHPAPPCAGEVDSAAVVAAGLNEWFPEFDPGCSHTR